MYEEQIVGLVHPHTEALIDPWLRAMDKWDAMPTASHQQPLTRSCIARLFTEYARHEARSDLSLPEPVSYVDDAARGLSYLHIDTPNDLPVTFGVIFKKIRRKKDGRLYTQNHSSLQQDRMRQDGRIESSNLFHQRETVRLICGPVIVPGATPAQDWVERIVLGYETPGGFQLAWTGWTNFEGLTITQPDTQSPLWPVYRPWDDGQEVVPA